MDEAVFYEKQAFIDERIGLGEHPKTNLALAEAVDFLFKTDYVARFHT